MAHSEDTRTSGRGGSSDNPIFVDVVDGSLALKEDKSIQRSGWLSALISAFAALVSVAALAINVIWNLPLGDVQPLQPSGYSVIRGNKVPGTPKFNDYASDRLVLPLEWTNGTGSQILISRPRLVLHPIDRSGEEDNKVFLLAEELPSMPNEDVSGQGTFRNSLVLDPHSVTSNILVFHIDEFWNENNEEDYKYKFRSGRDYYVSIEYLQTPRERTRWPPWWPESRLQCEPLFDGTTEVNTKLDMVDYVNELAPGGSSYFSLDEQASTDSEHIPSDSEIVAACES